MSTGRRSLPSLPFTLPGAPLLTGMCDWRTPSPPPRPGAQPRFQLPQPPARPQALTVGAALLTALQLLAFERTHVTVGMLSCWLHDFEQFYSRRLTKRESREPFPRSALRLRAGPGCARAEGEGRVRCGVCVSSSRPPGPAEPRQWEG